MVKVSEYDTIGIWLFYIQLAIFLVLILLFFKFFINIFNEHKKKHK